jgi:CheY-like chemotaxis protein
VAQGDRRSSKTTGWTAKPKGGISNTRLRFNLDPPNPIMPPPDCTWLDFNLPDMDSLEVWHRLRGENGRLPCAVVMVTAPGGEEPAVNAMKSGAMDYMPKGQFAGRRPAPKNGQPHRRIFRCGSELTVSEPRWLEANSNTDHYYRGQGGKRLAVFRSQ